MTVFGLSNSDVESVSVPVSVFLSVSPVFGVVATVEVEVLWRGVAGGERVAGEDVLIGLSREDGWPLLRELYGWDWIGQLD
jgi:hypothetical protein